MFTRPELKVERYSYDTLTPSAARNILCRIYWHPAMQYEIKSIVVMNKISRLNMTRNELDIKGNASLALKTIQEVEDNRKEGRVTAGPRLGVETSYPRQQRSTTFLRDVYYRIYAEIKPDVTNKTGEEFNEAKARSIFNRRVESGKCFSQPFLGTRECMAFFGPIDEEKESYYAGRKIDLGPMFFDSSYANQDYVRPFFFHPVMEDGIITIPTQKEVMGNAALVIG